MAEPVRVQQRQVVGQRGVVVGGVAAGVGQRQSLLEYVRMGVDGGAGRERGQSGLLSCARTWPALFYKAGF
ncbi:hypothetical protein D3C72_2196230 [compost metagenome]